MYGKAIFKIGLISLTVDLFRTVDAFRATSKDLFENLLLALGPQQKIIPHLACLLSRLPRYIHRHVSRYAPLNVPCRRAKIRRNLVELFLTVTLIPQKSCLEWDGWLSTQAGPAMETN
jgi:hypothetical protein